MKINNLKLTNFRNHKNLKLIFDVETVLLTGPNGSGKTNVLEAINLLSTTKSFKASYDRDMIKHTEDFLRIEAGILNDNEDYKLEMAILKRGSKEKSEDDYLIDPNILESEHTSVKKVKINGVTKSLQAFAGMINTVIFSPEHINMLTGSPSERRKYLDLVLIQVDKAYKKAHTEYIKTVRQRNKLLETIRDTGRGYDQLDFWNTKLLENGCLIQAKRVEMLDYVNSRITHYIKILDSKSSDITITYNKSELSQKRLDSYRDKEIASKNTLIGPHREDFETVFNKFNVAEFGSRGQQRTAILALKLSEIDFLNHRTEQKPILLLDDIFSELDDKHREAVINSINEHQTIITSTENFDGLRGFKEIAL